MKCIVVDDEPLARRGLKELIEEDKELQLLATFRNVSAASAFLADNEIDLVFLDIQMPGINGMEFAKTLSKNILIIFTTAYAEYALESYEVDAIDYIVKPIEKERFQKAVSKAMSYHSLLVAEDKHSQIEKISTDYFFIRADRKIFKLIFTDVLFVQGLDNYVIIHTTEKKIIAAMNVKGIHERLPVSIFVRVSKSYIINVQHIDSFDNNTVFIGKNEIPIGNTFRGYFFDVYVNKKLMGK